MGKTVKLPISNFLLDEPHAHVDKLWGPYPSLDAAAASIPTAMKVASFKFGVLSGGVFSEYIYLEDNGTPQELASLKVQLLLNPASGAVAGKILSLDNELKPVWVEPSSTAERVSFDNSEEIFDGDVTTTQAAIEALKDLLDALDGDVVKGILVNGSEVSIENGVASIVTNTPDEEDLTSVRVGNTDVLKFKDKTYTPLTYSGLGRKYLRKNIVDGVNVLTQAMINEENTIYIIQYDYVIDSADDNTITVPENCILKFEGGSLSNGTIIGNNTGIEAGLVKIFDTDVILAGTWNVTESYPEWFGADNTGVAAAEQHILKCFDISDTCVITKSYNITDDIVLPATKQLIGINRRHSSLIMTNGSIYPTLRNIIKNLNFVSITNQDIICLDSGVTSHAFQYLRISDLYITGVDNWNHTCDCIHIKCKDKGFEFINIKNIEIHTNVHSLIKVDGFVTDNTHYGWLTELSVTDCLVQRAIVVLDIQIPKTAAIIGCYFSNIASQAGNHSTNFAILDGVHDTIFDRMYAWDYSQFNSFDSVFLIKTSTCGSLKIYNTRGQDTRTLKAFDGVSNPLGCVLDFSQSSASRNYRVTCTDVTLSNIDNPASAPIRPTIQQTSGYNVKDVFGNTIYFSGWCFLSSTYWGGAPLQTLFGVDVRSLRAYLGRKVNNVWQFYPIESSNYANVTTNIPNAIFAGQRFYTSRVNNYIVFNGKRWINTANGFTPVKTIGTTSERPVGRWSERSGYGLGLRPTNGKMIFEKWSYVDKTAQKAWIANQISADGTITWVEETTLNPNAPYNAPRVGTSGNMPTAKYAYNNLYVGFVFYNQNDKVYYKITSLEYNGTDPDDDNAYSIKWDVVTETSLFSGFDKGFCYFDTTLNKPIYAIGFESTGVITWADAFGNDVSTVYPKVNGTPTSGNLAKFNGTDIEDAGVAPQDMAE